jgi:uncharacterized protein YbbK (DUF523 family)
VFNWRIGLRNGGHARDRYLTDILGQYIEYVPVCPEVECGLGVPSEMMRLEGELDKPKLVTSKTNVDHTQKKVEWAQKVWETWLIFMPGISC